MYKIIMLVLYSLFFIAPLYPSCIPTASDSLGPYYVSGMPVLENINRFDKPGEPLRVQGRILSSNGEGVEARIEVWQTDGRGRYWPAGNGEYTDYPNGQLDMRGTILSDQSGNFFFYTVIPGKYPGRPPHIHYRISAPGHQVLVTQHYIHTTQSKAGGECRGAPVTTQDNQNLLLSPNIYLHPN